MMMVEEGGKSDISVLGEELLVEILCRLGNVKYATQCRSVCKLWRSLVNTDQHWLRRWYQMNPKKESVTFITSFCVNLNFLPKNPVRVVDSHKDLLLCCHNSNDSSCYYVCNPFTEQWTPLPPRPQFRWRQPTEAESRYLSLHSEVGFTVDEFANANTVKFTVVCIVPFYVLPRWGLYDQQVQVSMFSSDIGWREMDEGGGWREMFMLKRPCCNKIVSYKGRLVLLKTKESSHQVRLYSWDLDTNYTRLPLTQGYPTTFTPCYPTNADDKFTHISTIGVCEGCLRIAQMLDGYKKLIVWELDDSQRHDLDMLQELEMDFGGLVVKDSESWSTTTFLYDVYTADMAFHPHDGDRLYIHVYMMHGYEWDQGSIFMCKLKTRRLELVQNLPIHIGAKLFPLVRHCWPTPVPRLQP